MTEKISESNFIGLTNKSRNLAIHLKKVGLDNLAQKANDLNLEIAEEWVNQYSVKGCDGWK